MKSRKVGVEIFHADILRDMKLKVASRNFSNAPKNKYCYNHHCRSESLKPYSYFTSLNSVRLIKTKLYDTEQDEEGYWPTLSLRIRAENIYRIYIFTYSVRSEKFRAVRVCTAVK
jgi:hypothetical protein